MHESFLVSGSQKPGARAELKYGQSVTDSCLGWEETVPIFERLASAVRQRRKA